MSPRALTAAVPVSAGQGTSLLLTVLSPVPQRNSPTKFGLEMNKNQGLGFSCPGSARPLQVFPDTNPAHTRSRRLLNIAPRTPRMAAPWGARGVGKHPTP